MSDATLLRALRTAYLRHRHDATLTRRSLTRIVAADLAVNEACRTAAPDLVMTRCIRIHLIA